MLTQLDLIKTSVLNPENHKYPSNITSFLKIETLFQIFEVQVPAINLNRKFI